MKSIQILRTIIKKRRWDPVYDGFSSINILETFPAFVANGWGLYRDRAPLTIKSVNQTIPALAKIASTTAHRLISVEPIEVFVKAEMAIPGSEELRALFTRHGSDKATTHNYHLAYERIIWAPARAGKILEIGLGTNNVDVVSTMGSGGKPGASLRAFRDYCPNAQVYGADFDKRILFTEERIRTFFVDQTDPDTFTELGQSIGDNFDLMIDDGLHAPNANLNSLAFFLPRIKVGGWAVIEDIAYQSETIWKLVGAIIPQNFRCHLVQTSGSMLFLVKRLQ